MKKAVGGHHDRSLTDFKTFKCKKKIRLHHLLVMKIFHAAINPSIGNKINFAQ